MKITRQNRILSLLNNSENKTLSTEKIAKALNVSSMTIRRDLNELSEKKLLSRTYGGASLIVEQSTNEKNHIQKKAKIEIGVAIASLIEENTTVYLDAGTTVAAACQFLPLNIGVQYITNSDLVFRYLVDKNAYVTLTGGTYNKSSNQFIGSVTVQCIQNFFFDKAFIGINGIFHDEAVTSNFSDVNIKKTVLAHSKETFIAIDSSKIGKPNPYIFSNIKNVDGIIVDSKLNSYQKSILGKQTKVIRAKALT
ncbi:DeoR/GlpR family DNA-binding transcription regulator [Lactobacillus sp. ESL0791]|uniref:DeoR/GlpR family DNA-binding transcription regulator n=1 Tax=Lactobacillus sp. ESL0791 TaxID=2983234 RepID=UPI0023F7F64F|nr:DeoR/GlpR family DNA-binding transcription regulator [Lactobacillus sp. ESL0791]MDF7638335.1 DeoR/GlpR family DNA-binding transcription regulator [Lactobacillus sp. ESL0791]